MMKVKLIKTGLLMGVAGLLFFACNKSENITPSLTADDIVLAKDDVSADEIYIDIDASVQDKLVELEESNFQTVAEKSAIDDFPCLEVTVDYPDSTRFPKVITLDYGTGCEVVFNGDTIFKAGKVIVTLTDHFFNPGAQRIVTFEDFYINEMKVEGILTNTYIGLDDREFLEFNLTVEGGKLIFADDEGNSLEYTRDADFTKYWDRERMHAEDTLYVDGMMWGVNAEGQAYSREIIETLTLVHCPGYGRRWVIIDGVVESIVDGVSTLSDYSDGGCDGTADIIRDGEHHRIRIHHHHRNRLHSGH